MSFDDEWDGASSEGPEGTDTQPPPDDAYEAVLKGASAFQSKKGDDWVRLEWEVVSVNENGHEWTVLYGFGSQGQANVTKSSCKQLGVDVDSVSSLKELDEALKEHLGSYYNVDVKTKGEYTNTYIGDKTTDGGVPDRQTDAGAPDPEPVAAQTAMGDDDDIPF